MEKSNRCDVFIIHATLARCQIPLDSRVNSRDNHRQYELSAQLRVDHDEAMTYVPKYQAPV
jgi:hypothetical protein